MKLDLGLPLRAAAGIDGGRKLQLKFLALSFLKSRILTPFATAAPGSLLHNHLCERPETIGALMWPYQCAAWSAEERLERILGHFEALEKRPSCFRLGVDDKLVLLSLDSIRPGARLILDQPIWLSKEGQLSLNLFDGHFRAYTLSFSIFRDQIFIGGIQGRNTDGALDRYRQMTKDFHGIRPRDLLIMLLQWLSPTLGATKIFAVADKYRYFRHSFFNNGQETPALLNYDEIWSERGGWSIDDTRFALPLKPVRRPIESVPSKKKNMYRNRYIMLDELEKQIISCHDFGYLWDFDAT